MKNQINILLLIITLVSCKNQTDSEWDKMNSELKAEVFQTTKIELQQNDSISELWNSMVFDKGGCLGGGQYYSEKEFKREGKLLVFNRADWKNFAEKDKEILTAFLIKKLADTTKTKVHTCPFFGASNGEMAVYSLQHIHKKNWFDFSEFNEYKNKEYKSATEQHQVWLQNILKNKTERAKLAELYNKELKK